MKEGNGNPVNYRKEAKLIKRELRAFRDAGDPEDISLLVIVANMRQYIDPVPTLSNYEARRVTAYGNFLLRQFRRRGKY